MELNIRAGVRVLYKQNNSNWMVGETANGHGLLTEDGLYIPVIDRKDFDKLHADRPNLDSIEKIMTNVNDIFFDSFELNDWIKDYRDYFMTKEDYIKFIESDEFDKRLENAFVSDGEYGYYPVSKYSKTWIEKQPFEYIVRGD